MKRYDVELCDEYAGKCHPLAARNTGRMAIGIELQEEYCATAARRLTK